MADRSSKAMWARRVAELAASGETTATFCKRRNLRQKTFAWWRWKLACEAAPATPVRFVDLEMTAPVGTPLSASAPIEILADGVVLRVEVGTSTGYVAALVADLRGRC
jgi:hypothetical protein